MARTPRRATSTIAASGQIASTGRGGRRPRPARCRGRDGAAGSGPEAGGPAGTRVRSTAPPGEPGRRRPWVDGGNGTPSYPKVTGAVPRAMAVRRSADRLVDRRGRPALGRRRGRAGGGGRRGAGPGRQRELPGGLGG